MSLRADRAAGSTYALAIPHGPGRPWMLVSTLEISDPAARRERRRPGLFAHCPRRWHGLPTFTWPLSFQRRMDPAVVDQTALMATFHAYARVLLGPYEIGTVLYQLTDQVVDLLDVDGAGVSLTHDDERLTFITATDANITAVEEDQLAHGQGPCHEAFHSGHVVAVDDLAHETRWDEYRHFTMARGVRAVVGIPMPVGEQCIGALNLYRHAPGAWSREDLDAAQLLADMASGYILNATQLNESRTLAAQLQHALDSRIVVEQAKGALAERHDIPVHEAFELLRSHARHAGTRIHVVCQEVIDGTLYL